MASNPVESSSSASAVGESSARVAIDVRRFPWTRRLVADYVFNYSAVAPFFAGNPRDHAAWADSIRRVHAHARPHGTLASILSHQQERRGAPDRSRAAARQFADPKTVAIVTGQQAGLFGGPLFTLLKSLTALKLAEQVTRDHGVPAVAVFWVEAEDHDWDEVRSCTVFDEALERHAVALPAREAPLPAPVASIALNGSIDAALAELERLLPSTEFRPALLERIRTAYRTGIGMADAFARWLEQVLGDRGLVVYDASDPAAKPLAAEIFARELSAPGTTARLANAAGQELTAHGYHSQVQAQPESVSLFALNGGRRPIRAAGSDLLIDNERHAADELAARARTTPTAFSPNVLVRPIVQDTIFPTVGYVAGPNELAYWGQLRGIYEHFGVPMPIVYQRASATLVDSAAYRFLQKYTMPFEALISQDDSALNQLLHSQIPPTVEASFSGASSTIAAQMDHLIQAIPALDPTLEGAARSTLGKMQHDLETLHGKMIQAAKRRDETLRRQFLRTRALAFPDGHAQERTIGFVSFLNQYGPALIDRLDQELPVDLGHHWVVAI